MNLSLYYKHCQHFEICVHVPRLFLVVGVIVFLCFRESFNTETHQCSGKHITELLPHQRFEITWKQNFISHISHISTARINNVR
jgi:hypothetical protein